MLGLVRSPPDGGSCATKFTCTFWPGVSEESGALMLRTAAPVRTKFGLVLSGENPGRVVWAGSHDASTMACRPTSTGGTIVRIVRMIGCIEQSDSFVGGDDDAQTSGALHEGRAQRLRDDDLG